MRLVNTSNHPTVDINTNIEDFPFNMKRSTYSLKQVFTPSEAAELLRVTGPLGPDPGVSSRTKSICFLMLGNDGKFRKLAQNSFNQPKLYNNNEKLAGFKRYFNRLSDECTESGPMIKVLEFYKDHFKITPGSTVLAQIQESRVEEKVDCITEQGIHSDGADNAMIICLKRKNVKGASNELFYDIDGRYPLMKPTTLTPGDAVIWRDNEVYHNVTPMMPENPDKGPGLRTVLLLHANSNYLLDGLKNPTNDLVLTNTKRKKHDLVLTNTKRKKHDIKSQEAKKRIKI